VNEKNPQFVEAKILAVMVAMVMALGLTATNVFAQDVPSGAGGSATITIKNAAKGETYKVFKLFDATVGTNGEIAYTGDIPSGLEDYFTKDSAGNIKKATGKSDAEIAAAVQNWGKDATGAEAEATSDGSVLQFTNLKYGYYAITSSQGATVTVTSTNPSATVIDKNSKTITVNKEVEKETYSIGDTVKYTATFDTVNFIGSEKVVKYVISDTLPEFLKNVSVTSIKVGGTAITTQQFTNKSITIPWVDSEGNSLYNNGAVLEIKYQGTLTDVTNINTDDTNTVSIKPYKDSETPFEGEWEDDAVIKTYAVALKKVDKTSGAALPGAQFTIKGLTVTGSDGEYTVVSYNSAADAAESAVLDTDANGKLYIVGLASDVKLTVTEYKAPDGYNKLENPITDVAPQLLSKKIYKTSGTVKYDAKGNVIASSATATTTEEVEKNLSDLDENAVRVENEAGALLPSTGGIGTTIFYAIGSVLVVGAGILLISKKRMFN